MLSIKRLFVLIFAATTVYAIPHRRQELDAYHRPRSSHTFTLSPKTISPDGFSRSATVVNGQFPGPLLSSQKGQDISVNVVNHLTDPSMRRSTSIHWHGIFQPGNSQDDGPSFVTQCPIAPGNSYLYNVKTGQQAGTFWYHSHLGTQYVDGIRGPLVIYDPHDPMRGMYDIDDATTVITLADWYQGKAEALLAAWRNNGNEPVPDSGLINGLGRFEGGPKVKLARINVMKGKRYRFRVVSLSANGFFDFQIKNHSMTVIEADGITHNPVTVNSMKLGPGQRYSVVVKADQKVANYWIRATQTVIAGLTSVPAVNPHFNGNNTFAVFHYSGASDGEPTDTPPTELAPGEVPLAEHTLSPLVNPGLPGGENPPDLHVINFDFFVGSPNGDIWTVNGIPYQSPKVPTLLNILANGFSNTSQFGPNENTQVIPSNATIEIVFNGAFPVGAGHAFHLHGHAFDVVQSVDGPPNFVNPPRRDVVQSGVNPVRVRFRTDNAGPWIVHCHIDWHLETGLAIVLVEDPDKIRQTTHPDPAWQQLCKIYDALDPALQ